MPLPSSNFVFLDIDINGHREAYNRARAFVAQNDLKYGFSDKDITKLGGAERKRVIEAYESDWEWSQKGPIELSPADNERIVIELLKEDAPLCCENFVGLCTGNKGKSKCVNVPLHYLNTKIHRVQKNFVFQGGDFVMGNGAGGESIWGGKFKDEKGALKLKHDARGVVSMGNSGKNSNGSQFFITFGPLKQLDGKHCVFGRVVSGFDVLDAIEATAGEEDAAPTVPVMIADCGCLD